MDLEKQKENLLDDAERDFLQYLVDKLNPKIAKIGKFGYDVKTSYADKELIGLETIDDQGNSCTTYLPDYKKGTMYKGMKLEKIYTLEELGLKERK